MRGTRVLVGAIVVMLAGCGGGGGGDNDPSGPVTINGSVSFQRIPFHSSPFTGLNYAAQQQVPARGITVQAIGIAQQVLATATTDANGGYSLIVQPNTQVSIRANAEIVRNSPQRQFRVVDDASGNQVHSFSGIPFTSSAPNGAQDLTILSGWSSSGALTGARAAAPFAVLDTIYKALLRLESVDPTLSFPALDIDWGPGNPGGETFYQSGPGTPRIVLSAEPNVDTDEYDEHVIAHEFGHYLEDQFSRSDSVGGPHGPGDRLDPRVAFGEGFGYAFAAIVMNESLVRDSGGNGQTGEARFDVDSDTFGPEGWFNESSMWSILWDLYDDSIESADTIGLGFVPLWEILTQAQRTTEAVTSVFTFVAALKDNATTVEQSQIDQLVEDQLIESPTMEPYGSTETNDAGSAADVLPIYTNITLGNEITVISTDEFDIPNKLSNRRFLRFAAPASRTFSVNVTGPSGHDVDAVAYRRGIELGAGTTETNVESFTFPGTLGETYVIEVYDCANAGCNDESLRGVSPIAVRVD